MRISKALLAIFCIVVMLAVAEAQWWRSRYLNNPRYRNYLNSLRRRFNTRNLRDRFGRFRNQRVQGRRRNNLADIGGRRLAQATAAADRNRRRQDLVERRRLAALADRRAEAQRNRRREALEAAQRQRARDALAAERASAARLAARNRQLQQDRFRNRELDQLKAEREVDKGNSRRIRLQKSSHHKESSNTHIRRGNSVDTGSRFAKDQGVAAQQRDRAAIAALSDSERARRLALQNRNRGIAQTVADNGLGRFADLRAGDRSSSLDAADRSRNRDAIAANKDSGSAFAARNRQAGEQHFRANNFEEIKKSHNVDKGDSLTLELDENNHHKERNAVEKTRARDLEKSSLSAKDQSIDAARSDREAIAAESERDNASRINAQRASDDVAIREAIAG